MFSLTLVPLPKMNTKMVSNTSPSNLNSTDTYFRTARHDVRNALATSPSNWCLSILCDEVTKVGSLANGLKKGRDSRSVKNDSPTRQTQSKIPRYCMFPVKIPAKCPRKEMFGMTNCNKTNSAQGYNGIGTDTNPKRLLDCPG